MKCIRLTLVIACDVLNIKKYHHGVRRGGAWFKHRTSNNDTGDVVKWLIVMSFLNRNTWFCCLNLTNVLKEKSCWATQKKRTIRLAQQETNRLLNVTTPCTAMRLWCTFGYSGKADTQNVHTHGIMDFDGLSRSLCDSGPKQTHTGGRGLKLILIMKTSTGVEDGNLKIHQWKKSP